MVFGEKSDFAIEALMEPGLLVPSSAWGRMCIWIGGRSLGDITDEHCSLFSAYESFREASDNVDSLWDSHFAELSNSEIYYFLDEMLYGYRGNIEVEDDKTAEEASRDWREYGKFNFLTNWGEMFDSAGKAFLLRKDNQTLKILLFDELNNIVETLECTTSNFRDSVRKFSAWYEEQCRVLGYEIETP